MPSTLANGNRSNGSSTSRPPSINENINMLVKMIMEIPDKKNNSNNSNSNNYYPHGSNKESYIRGQIEAWGLKNYLFGYKKAILRNLKEEAQLTKFLNLIERQKHRERVARQEANKKRKKTRVAPTENEKKAKRERAAQQLRLYNSNSNSARIQSWRS